MLFLSFLFAGSLLSLGVMGFVKSDNAETLRAFAMPGLFFGGAALLCSFYAIKEPRHGLTGASFLAFIAVLTSAGGLFKLLSSTRFRWPRSDVSASLTAAILGVSVLYLIAAVITWRRGRHEKMLAELKGD